MFPPIGMWCAGKTKRAGSQLLYVAIGSVRSESLNLPMQEQSDTVWGDVRSGVMYDTQSGEDFLLKNESKGA